MDFVISLLLLFAFFSHALAFPISRSHETSERRRHFQLYSSHTNNAGDDPRALSGLLGDMFEAKLEMSRESKELESLVSTNSDMPVLGHDGIYRIVSQNQFENFKAANADKLVFLKFSSPICAACRMLRQKFQTLHRSPKFADKPVVFADIVISNNKKVADPFRDFVTSELRVRRVPSIHFYGNGGLVDQIFCDDETGCSWPKIQQQMLDFVGQHYTTPTAPAQKVSPAGTVPAAAATSTTTTTPIEPANATIPTTTTTPPIEPANAAIPTRSAAPKRKMIKQLLSLQWLR